jgi:tetratricopeptide (TPR) repeat protein
MDIQKELLRYQRDIASALKVQANAEQAAADANRAYDKALAEWEAQNPALAQAKQLGADAKADAKKRLDTLREEAKKLLGEHFIEDLPEGFNQERRKVVKYDKQGFFKQAIQYFPHLLMLDEEAVEEYFTSVAKPQKDGSLALPERTRVLAAVEVVWMPKVEISNAKLSKLVFEDKSPEGTEPLTMIVKVKPQPWTRPSNFEALLTAPELPKLDDYSPEDESIPVNKVFNDDGTWKNAAMWDEEPDSDEWQDVPEGSALEKQLQGNSFTKFVRKPDGTAGHEIVYRGVPATEDIDF